MDNLYLVMPAYNEETNIEDTIHAWYPIIEEKDNHSKLVVADGGSTDHTHQILKNLQAQYSKLEIISDTEKQHGPKLIALYRYAIQNGADYIFQTDSDGQTNPNEFYAFWELRKESDAILGKRSSRGDGKARKYVELVLCQILRFFFNIVVPDANAPFRLMKAQLVSKYLNRLPKDYNLPNVMLTVYFVYFKEKVEFKSITFKARQGGTNSVNLYKIVETGWKALLDFYKFRKKMKDVVIKNGGKDE